jgi:hypothetical protein
MATQTPLRGAVHKRTKHNNELNLQKIFFNKYLQRITQTCCAQELCSLLLYSLLAGTVVPAESAQN